MKIKKILILFLLISSFFLGLENVKSKESDEEIFKAEVLRVLEEKQISRPSGKEVTQQNLELLLLEGDKKGERVNFYGIGDIDVVINNYYQTGDKVFVMRLVDEEGGANYYVTDYVRSNGLWYLVITFTIILLLIGGIKGFKALLSLVFSFLVILKVLIPLILQGYNPILVSILVVFLILFLIVYLTEGWKKSSHISVLSIALSLLITGILAFLFTYLTRLTGTAQGEIIYLIESIDVEINFRGLLLSAIIIGALGVINDMAIGQVAAVEQIKSANPNLDNKQVFKSGLKIGRSHLGAITNTLFLAYVGASLPLILLFSLGQEPFLSFSQIINNEEVTTEIVRTLVGVMGVFLVMPISTLLSTWFLNNNNK